MTLKFKKDSTKIREYKLERGQSVSIGRLDSNDIVIENLAVSGHHAKIDWAGNGFLLTDLKSKNGTFVNDQLAISHWLKGKDVITIGKHVLIFEYAQGEVQPDMGDKAMSETMVMDTGKYRSMLAKNVSNIAAQAGETEKLGILSFLSGGDGEVELSKKLTKLGKNASSDIVLKGFMVGQTAATISKRPDGYYLSYVGGISKPKVNGKAVKESVSLKQFDVIEIGSAKMQFIHKS
ncbi:FHA domain-containing protein [Desulfonema magnum]|uniref:FHA domain-containing protein n=1 Tax=Desulfonema magnum TaxID=45655 RepID=A0A975BER7_9BACT|nr:FHA domain-containing protein [Desulfonema magnum]